MICLVTCSNLCVDAVYQLHLSCGRDPAKGATLTSEKSGMTERLTNNGLIKVADTDEIDKLTFEAERSSRYSTEPALTDSNASVCR